ncbi:Uma2 family endonuclease [Mycobacterium hubeiense]|uniref:Uma2 family endonuclease n=1 Tax=Mycobacterium hubeiense TaxID=1867256 RepID=UPI000C7F271F|nr:Uma2 family endonuclease [Mycobacterium sp. QGD 101]
MTSVHLPGLLSIEEWDARPEDNSAHFELQEGVLIVTPRPLRPHARAVFRIAKQLDDQLPDDLEALIEFEVCVDDSYPPTVRIPDIVITRKAGSDKRLDGSDVLVAIEVVSPGSRRTDTVTKRSEYAEAGIGHYWIIELGPPATLTALHLAGDFGYQESPSITGRFTTSVPAALHLDLDGLGD